MRNSQQTLSPKQIEIADAALKIIWERGISALTTSTLAHELGVSSGAPFRHFGSKEEILDAAVQRVAEMVDVTYPKASLPPMERLKALFQARLQTVGKQAGLTSFLFSEQFTLALPPAAAERMANLVRDTRAFVLRALQEGIERGDIRKDLPPKILLPIVMGSFQHLVFMSTLRPDLGNAPKATEIFAGLSCLLAPNPNSRIETMP